tara:strand:- start:58 stop:270 length:213 start_codon:yes stop_codon:yes gene_type:complete
MLEVTIKLNDVSFTMKIDSDSVEDCVELVASNMSIVYGYTIDLLLYEEVEDDNIYIEQDVPKDHVQHEGM